LRIRRLDCDHYAVVVSAQATPSGNLFNAEKARKTHSTGRVYDGLFTRHWDQWTPKEKNSLWYGKLVRTESGQFRLSGLTNALHRTGLECPIRPFGGIDHFDLSDSAIIFVSKDPKLNPALNTKANVYLLEVGDWAGQQAAEPRQILVPSFEGAATSPTFSPDGSKAAFLMMQRGGYEADQNDIFVVNVIHARPSAGEMTVMGTSPKDWDRSPGSVCWTADGRDLLVTAEEHGTGKLFLIDGRGGKQPRALTKHGSIGDVRPLPDGRVFASGSSLVDNMFYLIIEPSAPSSPITWTNSHSSEGGKFGLKPSQISSIWTPASNPHVNPEIHSIVVRPSHHDATRKYPVAYLIHGGPQGAWADNWSTRWNPMVFAEQGYIVIAPNPTGSTGYGQAFTDAIRHNWGGDPYHDIVNVFDWASRHMPDADHSRAVALGASYGGYMMNW
jgi:dipeptidyl aminopeptidase/acylaminoacyl peptidase